MTTEPHNLSVKLNWWLPRVVLWVCVSVFSLLTLVHIAWIAITPKGFWKIPLIRKISAPAIPDPPTQFSRISIPITPGIPAQQPRISPSDLLDLSPGQRIYVIDCFYVADNQPTVFRVSLIRILISYPWLFLVAFIYAIRLQKRLTSRSTRTQPCATTVML